MHILYFHQHFSTPEGASGTRSYEMAKAMLCAGHTVTMICGGNAQANTGLRSSFLKGRRQGNVDGIEVIELDLGYANQLGFMQRIVVFLKFALRSIGIALTEPADVVFATTTPLTAGIPGIVARWVKGKPFVFEVRDLWPELPKAMGVINNPIILALISILEWVSYRSAHRLIGLSPGIVEGIVKRGVNDSKVAMIPNGCDLRIFGGPQSNWRPTGVADDQLLAIFTGAHGAANGLRAVLDAAAELIQRGRDDIRIALVGDGGEKQMLQARAIEEGLTNVVFLDSVPKTQLVGLMAGADIGLQILRNVPAFYYGTSPNKFFDYISAGLPVLCNYPGWLADLIKERDCGYAVAPDDAEALAVSLIEAADNREGVRAKGKNARQLAHDTFSRDQLSSQWVEWVCGSAKDK